jgi:hypothetical protein
VTPVSVKPEPAPEPAPEPTESTPSNLDQRIDELTNKVDSLLQLVNQPAKPQPTVAPVPVPVDLTPEPATTEPNTVKVTYNNPVPDQGIQKAPKQEVESAAPAEKKSVFHRYYAHSGRDMLSIVSVGYSTYFMVGQPAGTPSTQDAFKRHIINFEILEWRAKCFGMQMFNFEMGVNTPDYDSPITRWQFERGGVTPDRRVEATPKTMWFAYKPAIKFYIPCTKWLALELYGGAEVDLTGMWYRINSKYYDDKQYIPDQNFFVGAFGGLGFMLTGVPPIPLEIKAEYRHPVKGNTALVPQGIYISAQLHLAAPLKRNKYK